MSISFRPQLRSLLLLVNVLVLLLPVSLIGLLKIYESELIRQTESALIGQAALISSLYAQELGALARSENATLDYSVTLPADSPFQSFAAFTPITPHLDVATTTILSPGPKGLQSTEPSDRISQTVGKQLISVLKESKRITLCGIRIVDSKGVVVSSSGSELGLSLSNRLEIRRALQGYYSSVLRRRISDEPPPPYSSLSRKGWLRVLVVMPVIHKQQVVGAVLLSRSPIGVGKGLFFIRKHLLLAGGVMICVVIAITWITTVVISRPLKLLVARAKNVQAHGGKFETLDHPGTREIADLSGSISEMADTLQKRANYIQNFARHVSHEFKTPLTAMQGSIELMQDMGQEMSPEERDHFLGNMSQDVRHLDRLTRGLIELARADMTSSGSATCRPDFVIHEMASRYKKTGQDVVVSLHGQPQTVGMEPEVFRGILVNLVENSFSHGNAGQVKIDLHFASRLEQNMNLITISDDGSGIASTNHDKIFTPFFTTSRNRGGTGLGLAITKALVERHGGKVFLSAPLKDGCQFTLLLP